MEGPNRTGDINELLTRGFFTTSRGKSPNPSSSDLPSRPSKPTSSYHLSAHKPHRERSRSRVGRSRRPRPTAEDEVVSLARESSATSKVPSNDPPNRGIIDQVPLLLESDVTASEAARLQADPFCKELDKENNTERRFVFIPRSESQSSNSEEEEFRRKRESRRQESSHTKRSEDKRSKRREEKKETRPAPPPLERRKSRQDLPTLETKVPRDIPPKYRRSASAYASQTPTKEYDRTPKANGNAPQTPSTDYFLSPDVMRGSGNFSSSAPRYQGSESFGERVSQRPPSRPGTPLSGKRNSGTFEAPRSRRNSNEKSTRPKQLSDEHASRKLERLASGRFYSSSEDDLTDSDDDRGYKPANRKPRVKKPFPTLNNYERHPQSPSRSNRSSIDGKRLSSQNSRLHSPVPSPKVSPSQIPRGDEPERSQTFPRELDRRNSSRPASPFSATRETPRRDKLNPFDAPAKPIVIQNTRQSTTTLPQKQSTPYPLDETLPIPIPSDFGSSREQTRKHTSIPQYEEPGSASAQPPASKPFWQPPPFQPPANTHLEKPVGSYRRFSEDIERGSIPPLPTCPRMTHTRGRNDWLTLPNCPSFNICPQCYTSTISQTDFRNHFIQAMPRPLDATVRCDFGHSPWYRIAWLLTLKERKRDLNLFYSLADIASTEQPCLGKQEGVRRWHGMIDPKTKAPIHNFNVCHSCVKSIEALLPAIRGTFIRKDRSGAPGVKRVCDLHFDSKRFVQYFDALEVTADRADRYGEEPDIRTFASLARRLGQVDECERDTDLLDRKWHVITQLPEFTVCEECFEEVVWPELDDRKSIPLLFNKSMVRMPRASCQLYSPKMREIFRTAVDTDDYKLLASKARERKGIENAWKYNMVETKRQAILNPVFASKELQRIEEEWRRWE
ncbi:hypothetical protein BJ875DRAFT_102951 [Amylocarpus encephaloides]|uniref:Uncharacterized protein n=1 Tax=Amylocarpus encephaloides TaxID=45428 RepID=A0A9P7YDY4_9HELO|nr:hypothetical protein BJ875DRAFT_102951 [Amylocarpus encephaloides]